MKALIIKTSLFIGLFLSITWSFAGTFASNGTGGGSWNTTSSWVFQNDSDGIPDSDDDILITNSDIINWNTNSFCNNLTIESDGELKCTNINIILRINGNYQNLGLETGQGYYYFLGQNKSISGSGMYSPDMKWVFNNHTSIQSDVSCIKNSWTRFNNGAIITNYGIIGMNGMVHSTGTVGKWINATGSELILKSSLVSVKLDVSSFENTVECIYSSNGKLPNCINKAYYHLEIGNSNYSVILMSDFTIKGDLTIATGGGFKMNGFNIHLKGSFNNYQAFLQPDNSTLYMDGTSTQYLNSYIEPTEFSNLVIDNASGVFTGGLGKFTLSNSLVIANGEFNLGKNLITLLSDGNKTAYIGESNGTVAGTMTIQRFVSDRNDGYSDMSSSVTSAIFYEWTDDLNLAFGPYIPGIMSPSCWGYNESSFDYFPIETFNDSLVPGKGYEVYLTNDGDTNTPFIGTILDMVGTPNMGNISVPVTMDYDGWNLIGNPYASSIDWTHFRNNCGISMNAQFKYYDETINDFAIGNDGDIIAAGQGFWIETTESGNITFQESNKVINDNSPLRIVENSEEEVVIEKPEWIKIQTTTNAIELELLSETNEQVSISIYNLAGQEIISSVLFPENDNHMNIALPEMPSGIYIINILNGEKIESKKFYHN